MIDVTITNFQAIDHLHFEIDGFTALVGRSNIGKSSIVRALKCALTGSSSPDDVRHDVKTCGRVLRKTKKCQCFSSVKITFEAGPSMLWEKGDAVNRYTVWKDGAQQVYDRVGREAELPDFIGEQFSPVKMGSKHNLLQVSDQFDPLFLLDLSGTVVADTLSDLGQLDAVNKALALASKDRRAAASTRKVREGDHTEAQAQLARYAGLDYRAERVSTLAKDHLEIQGIASRVDLARTLLEESARAVAETAALSRCLQSVLPPTDALAAAGARRGEALAFETGWAARATLIRALTKALEPPLPEAPALDGLASSWRTAERLTRELTSRDSIVQHLDGIGALELPDADGLRETWQRCRTVGAWLSKLQEIKLLFDQSQKVRSAPDATFEFSVATTSVTRMRQADGFRERLVQLQTQEAQTAGQLEEAEREEAAILDEFRALGVCPACSQPLTPVHAARGSHATSLSISD